MKSILTLTFAVFYSFTIFACNPSAPQQSADSFYNDKVEVLSLLKSDQSWDGALLPPFPTTQPEIHVLKITIPPHSTLPVHYHPVINTAILVEGHMRLNTTDGKSKEFKAGDVFNEVVGTHHFCENIGDTPVLLYVFYASEKNGKPLTILVDQDK